MQDIALALNRAPTKSTRKTSTLWDRRVPEREIPPTARTAASRLPVRAHFNVMAWSDDREHAETYQERRGVAARRQWVHPAPQHHRLTQPALFGRPWPTRWMRQTFIRRGRLVLHLRSSSRRPAFFTEETNYRSSLSPFGIKMVDRLTEKTAASGHLRPADETRRYDQP